MNPRLQRLQREVRRRGLLSRPTANYPNAVALGAALGLTLDDWQTAVCHDPSSRILLNCSRQSGKSSLCSLLALHTLLSVPSSLVLCLSPTLRQSKLLARTVTGWYHQLSRPIPAVAENMLSLVLANDSMLVSLPSSPHTIRGYAGVTLLICDESSRIMDEVWQAVSPMLAVHQGRMIGASTPLGQRGWWHTAWSSGGDDWSRYEVPATACPRLPASFLEVERRNLPSAVYEREYECAFTELDAGFFRPEDVAAMFAEPVGLLFEPAGHPESVWGVVA